jgi:hypothetical protein
MTRTQFIGLGAAIVIVGLIGYFFAAQPAPSAVSNEADAAVRAQVTAFGQKLKDVSLLAPDAGSQIEMKYRDYIAPELLSQWKQNPPLALGRQTSSPWPDRIEVGAVVKQSDTNYRVDGTVIEITNADKAGEPAAMYPVVLILEKRGNAWLITMAERGAYSEPPQRTTMTGTFECLPHRSTSGPQTLECAFGLAKDQSDAHYALDTHLMSTYPVDYPTGTHLKVEGVLVPKNQLNTDAWDTYDIDGILSATQITRL